MNNTVEIACLICGDRVSPVKRHGYIRCDGCGHEILAIGQHQAIMINEELSETRIRRKNALDRFRLNLTVSVARTRSFLLDVGSGSGGFLLHTGPAFSRSAGIEITPQCAVFSRTVLGLDIRKSIREITETISVATFWHSLEHIPAQDLPAILTGLHRRSTPATRLIICVPNAGSMLYSVLGTRFPYYDASAHPHQYTMKSLQRVLLNHGFTICCKYVSPVYSMAAYLQGLLNIVCPVRNFLYLSLRRGIAYRNTPMQTLLLMYNLAMSILFFFPALALSFAEGLWLSRASVLTISAAPLEPKDH